MPVRVMRATSGWPSPSRSPVESSPCRAGQTESPVSVVSGRVEATAGESGEDRDGRVLARPRRDEIRDPVAVDVRDREGLAVAGHGRAGRRLQGAVGRLQVRDEAGRSVVAAHEDDHVGAAVAVDVEARAAPTDELVGRVTGCLVRRQPVASLCRTTAVAPSVPTTSGPAVAVDVGDRQVERREREVCDLGERAVRLASQHIGRSSPVTRSGLPSPSRSPTATSDCWSVAAAMRPGAPSVPSVCWWKTCRPSKSRPAPPRPRPRPCRPRRAASPASRQRSGRRCPRRGRRSSSARRR